MEELLDQRLRFSGRNSNQIARMVRAASACIENESMRPDMGEIVRILRGKEAIGLSRKKSVLPVKSNMADSYPELQQTKSEMTSHFALAMLGVEFEDDDHLHCR